MTPDIGLELREFTVRIKTAADRVVVGPLDAAFPSGQRIALVGKNGAGKTMLLDALAGLRHAAGAALLYPPSGARFDLSTGGSAAERARHVASLPQHPPAAPQLLVADRIAMGLIAERGPRAAATPKERARIADVARALDVHAFLARPLGALSGGEQKRVHLARVFVHAYAPLVLLDEPFAALDVAQHERVWEAMGERAADGSTVLFSTHHLARAQSADAVIGLRDGALTWGPVSPGEIDDAGWLELFR